MGPRRWLLRAIQGILVGSSAILPGISGGVLCVSFGIYQPLMALFAHPLRNFRAIFPELFPVGVGWLFGFFVFAKLITAAFSANTNLAVWLFIGLIAGTFPGLVKQAENKGRTGSSWAAMCMSFLAMLGLFLFLETVTGLHIRPNLLWFLLCGILWGVSLVIPGMTSSSILIFLGLFEPMTAGIAALEWGVVVPVFLGAALTVVGMARAADRLLKTHGSLMAHMVLGFVLASILVIVPVRYTGLREFAICLLVGAAGFTAAFWLSRREQKRTM